MRKLYYIVLDGAADRPIDRLGGRTPLEAAEKPYLDRIAKNGQQSMIEILPDGLFPESDSGILALLGYDPLKYYCGRGTLECLGMMAGNGKVTDVIRQIHYFAGFRINFATMGENGNKLERRVARSLTGQELHGLAEVLRKNVQLSGFDNISFHLQAFGGYRGTVMFASGQVPLSGNVSNTDPGYEKKGLFSVPAADYLHEIQKCRPLDETEGAARTAALVNEFTRQSREILSASEINRRRTENHLVAANCILFRDGGIGAVPLPQFWEKYGRSLSVYGQLPSEKAITELADGEFHYTKALDLQHDSAFLRKCAQLMLEDEADTVLCHLKGPDEPGHDNKPEEKVKAIEMIDCNFFRELTENLAEEDMIIVTCDHATPCEMKIHSNDKVPLLVMGKGVQGDGRERFSEKCARTGGCRVKRAVEVMDYVGEVASCIK